ncbi:type IV pilus assembly protein PilM [Candidatus Azambacteria bacterium]|nr:type IV pilus assembly protein PilM [Candidatus Azambacteria bacterium]
MWPFNKKQFLGIDIGTASIKLVQLSKKGNGFKLDTYGEFKVDNYLEYVKKENGVSYLKLIDEDIVRIIKFLLKESKAKSRIATMSLPTLSTLTTTINLPAMPSNELETAINFEAQKYIPIPIEEVILDPQFINTDEKTGNLEIFVAAFPKELIDNYSRISKLAGLKLKAFELETYSLIRALIYPAKDAMVLLDIGATSSNISIIDNGFIQITHNLDISGAMITEMITNSLGLEKKRAEELKIKEGIIGKEGEKEISKILDPLINFVISEVERVIDIYSKKSGHVIIKIILLGGSANIKGLAERFSDNLKIETIVADPFSKTYYVDSLDSILKEIGPSFSVAVGLAMKELITVKN